MRAYNTFNPIGKSPAEMMEWSQVPMFPILHKLTNTPMPDAEVVDDTLLIKDVLMDIKDMIYTKI